MSYKKVGWEDSPSSNTPILSVSLNQMDDGIEKANKGIVFGYSATFTSDGVLKKATSTEALDSGSFATSQTDIVTVFVADNVTKINNGAFGGCTSLKTIYIDNTVGNVDIVSGAVPSGVSIVYSNAEKFINVNELLASAIKSLKSLINANKTDWENRATSIETQHKTDVTELSQTIQKVKESALEEFASVKADVSTNEKSIESLKTDFNKSVDEINTTLDTKENVSNKVSVITHPSIDYYPDTKAVFDYVNSKLETPLADIESLKAGKLDKANFNAYKTSTDKAVNSKVNTTEFNTYKTATDKAVADNTKSIKANTTAIDKCVTDIANNSALINQNAIKNTTDKSTSIVLNDSSDCNIVNLICDEKDDSKQIAFYRKNLFDFSVCKVNTNDSATINSFDRDNCKIDFTTDESKVSSGIYLTHVDLNVFTKGYGVNYTKLGGKPVALSFDVQSDINCKIGIEFIKASYKYFDITSEKQRIVVTDTVDINKLNKALCFYTNKTKANITISNIQIEINNTATDYEDCDCQKATLANADVNSLHTYYPSTTVISDSDFVLTYVADNKNYIDNKILKVATALVAHESEVM